VSRFSHRDLEYERSAEAAGLHALTSATASPNASHWAECDEPRRPGLPRPDATSLIIRVNRRSDQLK
jgi:hypothetical protein